MAYQEDFHKTSLPPSTELLSKQDIVSRVSDRIQEGVERLQEATQNDLRAYHQAIVELDHVLLSDIATEEEAAEIVSQARTNGVLTGLVMTMMCYILDSKSKQNLKILFQDMLGMKKMG